MTRVAGENNDGLAEKASRWCWGRPPLRDPDFAEHHQRRAYGASVPSPGNVMEI